MTTTATSTRPVRRPVVARPGAVEPLFLLGSRIATLVDGASTGGAISAFDYTAPAGFPGPPLHRHPGYDEVFYVLEGELALRLGDEAATAPAGTLVYIPGDDPHTFANPTGEPVRFLVFTTSDGFDGYLEDLAAAVEEAGGPPPAAIAAELWRRYGMVPA